jgi:hypothetical protein
MTTFVYGRGPDGQIGLYAGLPDKGPNNETYQHSSYNVEPLFAGEIGAENGHITSFSNKSGHYLPPPSSASVFLNFLRQSGVNVDDAAIKLLPRGAE